MKKLLFLLLFSLCVLCSCALSDNTQLNGENLTNYTMQIDFDCTNKTLKATQTVDYINSTEIVLRQIKFHLYPNAFSVKDGKQKVVSEYNFDRAYPHGFDAGFVQINSVTNAQNQTMQYDLEGSENNIICVNLENPLYPTERTIINMQFDVKIPNILHRFGYGENTINVGNFYPVACVYENGDFVTDGYHYNGDPFYSEMANYSCTISYSSNYTIGVTGKSETTQNNGIKTTKSTASVVRDFAFILSDKFTTLQQKDSSGKVDLIYLYYDDENPSDTMRLMNDCLSTFSSLIGLYPYSTLTVSQSNFLHGGMEYPNLVFISDAPMSRDDYNTVVVHEIAHQWFYNLIGNNEYSEAWLDEGLTEYATVLFFENNSSYNIDADKMVGNMLSSYLLFVDVYTDVFGSLDTSMNRRLCDYASEPEYTYCVYIKGVLMLDNLRDMIGDSAFFLGLKNYYSENCYKIAKQDNFISAFQKASNKDIDKIIKSWLDGSIILQKT